MLETVEQVVYDDAQGHELIHDPHQALHHPYAVCFDFSHHIGLVP